MTANNTNRSMLLRKYNVPAPRYTSYPTVPYWDTTPSEQEWIDHLSFSLRENAHKAAGAAVYIHVPFCEKLCTFCGCNTRITKNHSVGRPYIDIVLKEWDLYRKKLGEFFPIRLADLHLGGGTPTFLSPDELKELLQPILSSVTLSNHTEFSIEIDPRVTTEGHFAALSELGFKRVSLGVQDFDPSVQKIINRIQPYDLVAQAASTARKHGFSSVNFDLIYGLPSQTLDSITNTFKQVLQLRPDRIAFYAYAHVPWIKPVHRKFTEADLPSAEVKRELYERGRAMLEAAGYLEVGMDHFSLPSDTLWQASQGRTLHRNFMGYLSRHVSPLLALGTSAISDSWSAFVQNEKIIEKYRDRIEAGELPLHRGHVLTREDAILRQHILNLMTRFETDWGLPGQELPFLEELPSKLAELVSDGLVEIDGTTLKISESGRPFIRNVSMAFDARLSRKVPETRLFSTSI